ncbi:hypothetical protein [Mesorhizobium kowhaii]|uniref:hypothetical protein n=1 Tax=Mesorhizobium kowhaii TaxID=1300272 RepID=UPI00142E558F|nr:hypothetical protein [Mesorhizobium kowhaii]
MRQHPDCDDLDDHSSSSREDQNLATSEYEPSGPSQKSVAQRRLFARDICDSQALDRTETSGSSENQELRDKITAFAASTKPDPPGPRVIQHGG